MRRASNPVFFAAIAALWAALLSGNAIAQAPAAPACTQPVYLTFDTGHMGVAPLIAKVLQRQQVKVTFFVAQEKTQLETSLSQPMNSSQIADAGRRLKAVNEENDALEARWLELTEAIEAAQA